MVARITTFAFDGVEAQPADVRERVARARELQASRFDSGPEGSRLVNADMPLGAIDTFA